MKNVYAISIYTLKEALSKKIFITLLIISTILILIFGLSIIFVDPSNLTLQNEGIKLSGSELITAFVKQMQVALIVPLYGLGIFLSIFSTAGFIPSLLEKGNIDLFLSKPITRAQLLSGKFLGVLLIVLLNTAYLVISAWFIIGLKFSVWNSYFLITIISTVFAFASLFALSALFSVLTKNSILSMILAYLIYIVLSPLLASREDFYPLIGSQIIKTLIDGLYYIIPKTAELGMITSAIAAGAEITDYQPIISTFLFIILIFSTSIFIFNKRDY